ncbi:MAG: autotransporter domain-containing protein [Pseudomonadota bacterium]
MYNFSHRLAGIAAGLLLTSGLVSPAQAEDYYFGDSDLEQGNFYVLFGIEEGDIDDDFPYFCEGRLCRDSNGPVWTEILTPGVVAALGTDNALGPLNFAVSGAHMTATGDDSLPIPTGVVAQVASFSQLVDGGAISVSGEDRFFIHGGPNDLERLFFGETSEQVTQAVVSAALSNVGALADLGARTIVISNVQATELLPAFQDDAFDPFREVFPATVSAINTQMLNGLSSLKDSLPGETHVILVDHNAFSRQLVANFAELGFSNATDACLDPVTDEVCASGPNGQDTHVFFDTNHYSAGAHRLLASWYAATLNAASGAANADAAQISNAIFASSEAISRVGNSAFRLAGRSGRSVSVFGAPIYDNLTARSGPKLRQRGGVGGVRFDIEGGPFGGITGAYLQQEVATTNSATFDTKEWGIGVTAGYRLGPLEVFAQANYSRPTVDDFTRQTGALKLSATGQTKAQLLSGALGLNGRTTFDRLNIDLSARAEYRRVRVDAFDETGADGLELAYEKQRENSLSTFADIKVGWELAKSESALSVQPFIQAQDRRLLSGDTITVTSQLIDNTANSASLAVANPNFNSTSVGGGLALGVNTAGTKLRFEAGFQRQLRGPFKNDDRFTVGLSAAF